MPRAILPAQELVCAEPECDLAAGALHRVAPVNHIPVRERRREHSPGQAELGQGPAQPTLGSQNLTYLPTSMQKSPRMVPGAASAGFVAPMSAREARTTSRPCHTCRQGRRSALGQRPARLPARPPTLTMATTGPEPMYLTRRPKKGRSRSSA